MNTELWIVCGLAAFDAILVVGFFLLLWSQRRLGGRDRLVIAAGLSGFVFHAFLFFEGAILYVHLATLAVLYALVLVPRKAGPAESDTPLEGEKSRL